MPIIEKIISPIFESIVGDIFGIDLSIYAWFPDSNWKDRIRKQELGVDLLSGRFNDVSGLEIGLNEANLDPDKTLNVGPGAYEQLMLETEKIDGTSWAVDGSPILTATTFKATIADDRIKQSIQTVEGELYTLYFDISTSGQKDNLFLRHFNSPTGPRTEITGVTSTPQRKSVTFLGRIGDGIVQVGFSDRNVSDWAVINITKAQFTHSTYPFPYAPNDSAVSTLLVPANNSTALTGYSYPIEGALLDAFDGVADGVELSPNYSCDTTDDFLHDEDIAIVSIGGELEATVTGTGTNHFLRMNIVVEPLKRYEFNWLSRLGTMTQLKYRIFDLSNGADIKTPTIYTAGPNKIRFDTPFDCVSVGVYILSDSGSIGTVYFDNISVKQISPAQATFVLPELTPKFNAADISGTISIITTNDDAVTLLRYNADLEQFELFDGTNTAIFPYTMVQNLPVKVEAAWGDDTGQKMWLIVNGVVGTKVTNAGRFPVADKMKFGFDNEQWFKIAADPDGPYILKGNP